LQSKLVSRTDLLYQYRDLIDDAMRTRDKKQTKHLIIMHTLCNKIH